MSKNSGNFLTTSHRLKVFENWVLRICDQKRDEETAGWTKPRNKDLHIFYSSPSVIRMVKSRRIRWTGHVARMEKRRIILILFNN
jgi:hypothetical protein